jgi:protein involved in polysaccharide export with SLBB domain
MRFDYPKLFIISIGLLMLAFHSARSQTSSSSPETSNPGVTESPTTGMIQTPVAGAITTMEQLDNKTPLKVGDLLTFRILEDEDAPSILLVTDSGQVQIPYVGNVVAVNKTPRALAFEVKKALEGALYKKATVLIALARQTTRSPGRVYVSGEVIHQGPVELPAGEQMTVSRAIIQAGGFSDFGNKRKVRLIRKNRKSQNVQIVDVAQVLNKGRVDLDVPLQAGDVIVVPARIINW